MQAKSEEESKQGSVRKVFSMPYVLQQIFQFCSPLDLILKLQFLSKTARASLYSQNQFLRWSLKNALGQNHQSQFNQEKGKKQDLLKAARALLHASQHPPPLECLAFRSTLGEDLGYQTYNLGVWKSNVPFCSAKPAPGLFTMIPLNQEDQQFEMNFSMVESLLSRRWYWVHKLRWGRPLRPQHLDQLEKEYVSRLQELGLEKYFQGTIQQLTEFATSHKQDKLNPSNCSPELSHLLEEEFESATICYDFRKQLLAMKSSEVALFKFLICTTNDCTQNLRFFVLVLHDLPLKVEKTELYRQVKKWRNVYDINKAVSNLKKYLPSAFPVKESQSSSVVFFSQSYYRRKPKEEVRLLCWGECKESAGFFSFRLPEVVSTRFITLVATGVHPDQGDESVNVDMMKFIPCGALVPCL